MSSDDTDIRDTTGISVRATGIRGLDHAVTLADSLDDTGTQWQVTIIRQNMESFARQRQSSEHGEPYGSPGWRADYRDVRRRGRQDRRGLVPVCHSPRRGCSTHRPRLDGRLELFQLIPLGPGLYNGVSGIGTSAPHAAVTGCGSSAELALAGLTHLREGTQQPHASRYARHWESAAERPGSAIYSLPVLSKCLHDKELLADAHIAAAPLTADLIAADNQLDASRQRRCHPGAASPVPRHRVTRCARPRHPLRRASSRPASDRAGRAPQREWPGVGLPDFNGTSDGAAGYAYALASSAQATGSDEFNHAATECIAFENASYDPEYHNWADLDSDGKRSGRQVGDGAPGIGLARIAMAGLGQADITLLQRDITNALTAVERMTGIRRYMLCCGTLGSVESAAKPGLRWAGVIYRNFRLDGRLMSLKQPPDVAITGGVGDRWFNPGMFQGLAGAGYTILRRIDDTLPNVLVWE